MPLSENEAKVLGAVHLQADAPAVLIARETGLREHTIRRCIDTLRDRKIIAPYAVINVAPLGLADTGIYFSLSHSKSSSREQCLAWITRHPQVAWVAELSGEYQYAMSLVASHPSEVREILEEITVNSAVRIVDKAVASRVEYRAFRARYLSERKSAVEQIVSLGREGLTRIDELDHAILAALSDVRYRSVTELGRSLKVPPSTAQYRIDRLRSVGIIRGFIYRLNLERIGYSFFRILIFEKGASKEFHKKLVAFCTQNKNITGLVRCLGSWDYEIRVEVPQVKDFAQVVEAITSEFDEYIDRLQAMTSLQTRKLVSYPFTTFSTLQRSLQSLKEAR